MKRADAYAKLVEHCDLMAGLLRHLHATPGPRDLKAKTRRLIRALLVERAKAVHDETRAVGHRAMANLAYHTVLRRPATRRGK